MIQIITKSPVFKGIDNDQVKKLLNETNHQIRTYPSGTLIYHSGDECSNFLTVIEGSVKGEMTDISGKIIRIEDIEAPQHIAAAFLFGHNNRFPVNVIANNDVKICFIPKASFVLLLQNNQLILKNYLDIISNRAQFLSNKIMFLSFKTIKGKIANFILELSLKQKSDSIILPQSRKDLSDFFGVARPSLARIIGELEGNGMIKAKGKNIDIIDKDALIRLMY